MSIMHNINKSRVSLLSRLKCDRPALHRVKNILVITELIITTLFYWVLIVRCLTYVTKGLCAYPAE